MLRAPRPRVVKHPGTLDDRGIIGGGPAPLHLPSSFMSVILPGAAEEAPPSS
jgi:hypothetical protein